MLITTSGFAVERNASLMSLREAGAEIVVNPMGRRLTEAEARDLMAEMDPVGLIAGLEPITPSVLAAAPSLKVVSRCGAGVDNVDLEAAAAQRVQVRNTPEAPGAAVAELTVGLMLAVLRRICEGDREVRAGRWPSVPGAHLGARTVGLIGFGRIGRRVATLLAPFGCEILASDPAMDVDAARNLGVTIMSMGDLNGRADVVSLHMPLTPDTRHLVDAAFIARLPAGAVVINTARGGLVDEPALLAALDTGHLSGAALDVFEEEPYRGPLSNHPAVVLSPHAGSRAREVRGAMEAEAADNLLHALRDVGLL